MLAREADWHFQSGRRFYQEGDEKSARKEFDRAIDVLLNAPDNPAFRTVLDRKLDDLVETIHRLDLAGLGAADLDEPSFEKPPLEDIPQLTFPVDPKLKNKVLEEARAAASQLPLQVNDPILSYIKYFSTDRGRRILLSGLRRAGRYRPMIQRIFDEEGVPQELIFLAQAESGFLPRAVSRMKATGMWQFMQLRGREYGLVQTPHSDDRLDPEKATRAAARHLRDLYQRYGDWYLAIAAYNCGPGTIDKGVERTGYADFWELRRRNVLPKETANYLPIILAMTIMAKNPQEYGLEEVDPDPALTFDQVEITAPTNLLLLADLAECPVSEIRELNPALLKNIAPARWQLRVPKGAAALVRPMLATIPEEKRNAWRAHRVGDSDSLASIARRYRVTESSIVAVNDAAEEIQPGDLLVIPAAPEREPKRAPAKHSVRKQSAARKTTAHKGTQRASATIKHRPASIAR
jgi:membrane-bound lytic murein transglycosylase D